MGTGRVWIVSLLWVNLSVLLVVLVQTADASAWDAQHLLRTWAYSLVYANVTALPAILALPAWVKRFSGRGQVLAAVVGSLSFAAVGCLTAQAFLMLARIAVPHDFWTDYLH